MYVTVDTPNLCRFYIRFRGGGQLKKPPCICIACRCIHLWCGKFCSGRTDKAILGVGCPICLWSDLHQARANTEELYKSDNRKTGDKGPMKAPLYRPKSLHWISLAESSESPFKLKIHNFGEIAWKRWKFCCPTSSLRSGDTERRRRGCARPPFLHLPPKLSHNNDPPHLLPQQFLIPAHFALFFLTCTGWFFNNYKRLYCIWSFYGIFLASRKYERDVSGKSGSFSNFSV